MKKLVSLLLLLTLGINSYSQDDVYSNYAHRDRNNSNTEEEVNLLSEAGLYLKKSANYEYVAIGLGTASIGCLIGSALIKDKYEYKNGEATKIDNATKNGLLIGGGVCALIGLICEINAIQYKFKSGKCLQLQGEKNGAGLAFVF